MGAVYKKEFKSYFTNMMGYVFIAFVLVVVGIYTSLTNLFALSTNFEYVINSISFMYLIVVPILTMSVLANEKRQKTDQLLFTSPASITKIIFGKYFAMITVLLIPVAFVCLYPFILSIYGDVHIATALNSLLGFFFLGSTLISIGMFMSSLTESQIIAAVTSIGVILLTYLMPSLASLVPATSSASFIAFTILVVVIGIILHSLLKNMYITIGVCLALEIALAVILFVDPLLLEGTFASVLGWLSMFARMDNFVYGMLDISALVYYITVSIFFNFLTIQIIEKRRWS